MKKDEKDIISYQDLIKYMPTDLERKTYISHKLH